MNTGNGSNDSVNWANQQAAQQGLGLGQRDATIAERRLLEAALGFAMCDGYGEVPELARAVLRERLPPDFESTLRDLCFRAWDALEAKASYQAKHPLAPVLVDQFHAEWKSREGRQCKP